MYGMSQCVAYRTYRKIGRKQGVGSRHRLCVARFRPLHELIRRVKSRQNYNVIVLAARQSPFKDHYSSVVCIVKMLLPFTLCTVIRRMILLVLIVRYFNAYDIDDSSTAVDLKYDIEPPEILY